MKVATIVLLVVSCLACGPASTAPVAPASAHAAAPSVTPEPALPEADTETQPEPSTPEPATLGPPAPPPEEEIVAPAELDDWLHLVVAVRLVRKGPFADEAQQFFATVPGFPFRGGDIDALRDLELLLVSVPSPRTSIQHTIVVRHRLGTDELVRRLDAAFAGDEQDVEWSERDGRKVGDAKPRVGVDEDRRVLVVLDDDHVAYVHPKLVGFLDGQRARLATFAREHKKLTIAVDTPAVDIPTQEFPPPTRARFTVDARTDPTARASVTFADEAAAKLFMTFWNKRLPELLEQSPSLAILVKPTLDATTVRRSKKMVDLSVTLSEQQVVTVIQTILSTAATSSAP